MALTEPTLARSGFGQFVLLHERDNILVCSKSVAAGTMVEIDGRFVPLLVDIELGHKIARTPLVVGEKVLRYGIPIGSITKPVQPGEHVHSHNLQSDYIAAHDRESSRIREILS